MNAVIARQLHDMLQRTKALADYSPPSTRTILSHGAAVYGYSFFVASWTLWTVLPHWAAPAMGVACLPVEHDVPSSFFFWLVFIPAFVGIPTVRTSVVAF